MKARKYRYFACDFETTVYENQDHTEVWAAGISELFTDRVEVFHSIVDFFDYLKSENSNIIAYFHNLKFDGNFILSYLIKDLGFSQSIIPTNDEATEFYKTPTTKMENNSVSYNISDMGQWYTITVKLNNRIIEFRDSLKLLPFTLKRIGESFGTKHKKLEMEYKGYRYAGCEITDEEISYIKNDVYVLKEALEIMFSEGHDKLTIGACCLSEFKNIITKELYDEIFPDVYEMPLDSSIFGTETIGDYIRKAYRGGWCYLVKGKENKIFTNGTTADVNSLYPSMMHSQSGNIYPIGTPIFWEGNYVPEEAIGNNKYFFVTIRTRFYIKPNYLPFIQIKNNLQYRSNESLETSDYYDKKTGKYYTKTVDPFGNISDTKLTITMTQTDYILFLEHYNTVDFEILHGCYFNAYSGIFDDYIDKYKQIKTTTKGAKRELAKLFLNNLYGKMAASKDSSYKYAFVKEDKSLGFQSVISKDKTPGYIPVGAAITSYARNFTIRAAQANYHGKNKRGFIYADTDSIHCDLKPEEIKGIKVHPTDFCAWKLESGWDKAIFARQKTYIEHITIEDGNTIEKPYNNIKCAGMPDKCKILLNYSLTGTKPENIEDYTIPEQIFLQEKRSYEDFKLGLIVPGKLRPVRINGGVLLVDTTYEMR